MVAIATLLLVPFLGKPFHMDDTLFLKMAERILEHPFDPYGGTLVWYEWQQSMADVMQNPPLGAYWIALPGALTHFNVFALHVFGLLPAVAIVLGTYALAARFSRRPATAALLVASAPIWLVSSTNIMCDALACALFVWTAVAFLHAFDRASTCGFVLAGVLGAAAFFAKYPCIFVVPLLSAYALARLRAVGARAIGPWCWFVVVVAIGVAVHEAWTAALYGAPKFLGASLYAGAYGAEVSPSFRAGAALAMLGAGACGAGVLAVIAFAARGKSRARAGIVAAVVLAMVGSAAATGRLAGSSVLDATNAIDASFLAQLVVALGLGIAIFIAALAELRTLRSTHAGSAPDARADALLLALWVLGFFAFAAFVNWTVNARSLLLAVPAVAVVIARALDSAAIAMRPPFAVIAASAAIALVVSLADQSVAVAQRDAAVEIMQRARGATSRVWFQGHWGFQRAMEELGAEPVDFVRTRVAPGEWMALPDLNTNVRDPDPAWTPLFVVERPVFPWATTIDPTLRAGFYWSSDLYPLPFVFGRPRDDRTEVYVVGPPAS